MADDKKLLVDAAKKRAAAKTPPLSEADVESKRQSDFWSKASKNDADRKTRRAVEALGGDVQEWDRIHGKLPPGMSKQESHRVKQEIQKVDRRRLRSEREQNPKQSSGDRLLDLLNKVTDLIDRVSGEY